MTKITKKSRNIALALAFGDGCIHTRGYLSMRHGLKQKEYLEYKKQLLNSVGIKTTDCYYVTNGGYGSWELRTYTHDFFKAFRKLLYKPSKNIAQRKVLNKLTPLGIAIWYMDDGGLSKKKKNGKISGNELMLNTGLQKEENQIIIDYFKEVWDISFNQYKNHGVYRLACGTKEARKFIKIVKPYVEQVPSMLYKIDIKPQS